MTLPLLSLLTWGCNSLQFVQLWLEHWPCEQWFTDSNQCIADILAISAARCGILIHSLKSIVHLAGGTTGFILVSGLEEGGVENRILQTTHTPFLFTMKLISLFASCPLFHWLLSQLQLEDVILLGDPHSYSRYWPAANWLQSPCMIRRLTKITSEGCPLTKTRLEGDKVIVSAHKR